MAIGDRLTVEQKRELWQRWKRGETLTEIGYALDRSKGHIHTVLRLNGGIAPADRKRRDGSLEASEREEISRGLIAGLTYTAIAKVLDRAVSTVSREVTRNGGRDSYRALEAENRAWREAARPKACMLAQNTGLRDAVSEKLWKLWSPQQISAWLKSRWPGDGAMRVSHETIYKSLFIQARGVLKRELLGVLRSHRVMRRCHGAHKEGIKRSLIPAAVSIRERPAAAEDRAVPGHWEGDLIQGGGSSQIATLVERRSRYVMLVRLESKASENVVAALSRHVRRLPSEMMASLTWDRGSEMAAHAKFTLATKVDVYFCDPHSPWQRGSNENTNGLLRQYFPKGLNLSRFTQADLDAVARQLNERPRQTLGFRTPAEVMAKTIALTG